MKNNNIEESIKKVLTEKGSTLVSLIDSIEHDFEGVAYSFMPGDEFKKLKKVNYVQSQYWYEIMQRIHMVALTSLLRNRKWINGIIASDLNKNYYSFASCLRGFIESCSDACYTLQRIPLTVSKEYNVIKESLEERMMYPYFNETLEDSLIHYIYGRKLSNGEKDKAPKSHNAEQVRTYLESIKKGNEKIVDLYSELCQVSHPATSSMFAFLYEKGDNILFHKENVDDILIDNIIERFSLNIYDMFYRSTILSLITLKLLNSFEVDYLKTNERYLSFLNNSDLWKECTNHIQKSDILYKDHLDKFKQIK